jgi:tRNA1Val (adenine37-N6)-methyltransferase
VSDLPENRAVRDDETLDRLTRRLSIIQKRRGHRAASDDTLLAWAAARARPDAARALDLGTGKGAAALLLLARLTSCRVVGVEAVPASHDLAVRNAALNRLGDRYEPRLGDLRDPSILADLPPFDLVTGAPPFMPLGTGVLPGDETRAAARFELRGGIRDYAEAAAGHLAPDGIAVILMDGLERSAARTAEALSAAGLRPRRIVAVRPRPGEPPTYRIFVAGFHAGRPVEETICMRAGAGDALSAEYLAVREEMDLP